MENRIIRNYCEDDDLDGIIELYRSKKSFFTRDVKHFKHFLNFPGVQRGGVFVSLESGSLDGIMIISILKDNRGFLAGRVVELFATNILSMENLVKEAEAYCINKGADVISLRPIIDVGIRYMPDSWIEYNENWVMMAKPLFLLPILNCLLNLEIIRYYFSNKSLVFIFDDEVIKVQVCKESLDISYQCEISENSDLLIIMESKTFLGIIFGSINPYIACFTNKVRIHRVRDTFIVLRFLSSLKIDIHSSVAIVDSV